MRQDELLGLFSRPVLITELESTMPAITDIAWANNYTNSISESTAILTLSEWQAVLHEVMQRVRDYFHGVMRVNHDTEIYITESWLNKTDQGQSHHRHWHPNSVLSGVVFLQGDADSGALRFITSEYAQLEFDIVDSNLWNAKSWSVPARPGTMVLFPSGLEHMTETYQGDASRISLSFNTFVRGPVNTGQLMRLKI